MLNKETIKDKILKKPGYYRTLVCFMCGLPITKDEVSRLDFEQIGRNFIHTSCWHSHMPNQESLENLINEKENKYE